MQELVGAMSLIELGVLSRASCHVPG